MALRKDIGIPGTAKKDGAAGRVTEELSVRLACLEAEKEVQRRELEALRESESGLRAVFDRLPIGVYRTTPDGKVLMANTAMVRMLGFRSFRELAEKNLEGNAYYPDYTREWFKGEITKQGELRGLEATWTRADKTQMRVRENTRVVRAEDGTVLYYEGTVEDITEQKEAEDALKAKAGFLEEVITNASIGIFVVDEDNRYILINPECGRIVGLWPDDWTGKEAGMHLHPEDTGKAIAHFIQAISGEANECEVRVQASDGTYKHCRVQLTPMQLAGRAHVLALVTDVTNLRSAERELMQQRTYGLNTVLVLAISAMAGSIAPADLEKAMHDFTGHFARHFKPIFEDDMQLIGSFENPDGLGNEGPEAVLKRFLKFFSTLLSLMGTRTEHVHHKNEGSFEILKCPWLEDARLSPVPCRVCRTILCDTFQWSGLNGTAEQVSTQAGGANSCRFDFRIGPRHPSPKE